MCWFLKVGVVLGLVFYAHRIVSNIGIPGYGVKITVFLQWTGHHVEVIGTGVPYSWNQLHPIQICTGTVSSEQLQICRYRHCIFGKTASLLLANIM